MVHVKYVNYGKKVNHQSKFTEKTCEPGSHKFGSLTGMERNDEIRLIYVNLRNFTFEVKLKFA